METLQKEVKDLEFFQQRCFTVQEQLNNHIHGIVEMDRDLDKLDVELRKSRSDYNTHMVELERDCLVIRRNAALLAMDDLEKKKNDCYDEYVSEANVYC